MIRLIKIEFYKLWSKKLFIISLFAILLMNLAALAYMENLDTSIPPSAYQKLQAKLETIPNEQRFSFIEEYYDQIEGFEVLEQLSYLSVDPQKNHDLIENIRNQYPNVEEKYGKLYYSNKTNYYTATLESEMIFIKEIYNNMSLLQQYPQYLESIQTKAKTISNISIFQSDEMVEKRIIKSANDYQNCNEVEIIFESEHGIQEALSFPVTNFLIILTVFIITVYLIFEEKENGLFTIIKTTYNGGLATILAKLIVMIVTIGIVTFLLTISNLIYMSVTCGLGDLNRSIQSLSSYQQCTYLLSVKEYLLIYLIIKCLAASLIGLMMIWVSLITKNKILALTIIIVFIAFQLICYVIIHPLDALFLLKYLNLISMLKSEVMFQYYYNVNLFGSLISLQLLTFICLLFSNIFFFVLSLTAYHRNRNMQLTSVKAFKIDIHKKIALSLWKQEGYKIWWLQKGILFIVLAVVFQCYQFNQINVYRQPEELVMIEYMKKLFGPLTVDKAQFIKNEEQRFLDIHTQLERANQDYQDGIINKEQLNIMEDQFESLLTSEPVFQQILTQYQKIIDDPEIEFVLPYGYQELFSNETWGLLPALFAFILAMLSLSNTFVYDYQNNVNKIIMATVNGIQRFQYIKIINCIVICLVLNIVFYLTGYLKLNAAYGLNNWLAPIKSLGDYMYLSNFSILAYFVFCYSLRLLALLTAVFFMLAFSKRFKNQIVALIMTVVLFLVPLFLAYSGYHFLDMFSLYPLLMSDIYIKTDIGIIQLIISFIVYLAIFISSFWYLTRPLISGNKSITYKK